MERERRSRAPPSCPVEEGKDYEVEIIDQGKQGDGIAKIDGYVIFVQGASKGERVKVKIMKALTSFALAEKA